MARITIERKPKTFELRGHIQMIRMGRSERTREEWCLISVAGFTFFLDPAWIPPLQNFDEGMEVIVRGEHAGERIQNGNRVPNHDVYEIEPVSSGLEHSKRGTNGTAGTIPRVEKGAPA